MEVSIRRLILVRNALNLGSEFLEIGKIWAAMEFECWNFWKARGAMESTRRLCRSVLSPEFAPRWLGGVVNGILTFPFTFLL